MGQFFTMENVRNYLDCIYSLKWKPVLSVEIPISNFVQYPARIIGQWKITKQKVNKLLYELKSDSSLII